MFSRRGYDAILQSLLLGKESHSGHFDIQTLDRKVLAGGESSSKGNETRVAEVLGCTFESSGL